MATAAVAADAAPAPVVAETVVAMAADVVLADVANSPPAPKVHAPPKAMAAAVPKAVAMRSTSRQQASPTKVAPRAHRQHNLTPCVPASI